MSFDSSAPSKLKKSQKWFASIIARPIDEDSRMNPISPSGNPMEEEAWDYILPSPTLRPAQRIQIYNQQYWWRLLNTLHESFPLVTRLFGYHDFNQTIGFPYLTKYPPNHWSLNLLGNYLPEWVQEHYHRSDKQLIANAAKLDSAYNHSFLVKELEPLRFTDFSEENLDLVLSQKLYLQPSLHLFEFDYNLFAFRRDFLKEDPDYWIDNDFPPLQKDPTTAVLFRNANKDVVWCNISKAELYLLDYFRNGASIEEAVRWLEVQQDPVFENATEKIHDWFQFFAAKGWFSSSNGP